MTPDSQQFGDKVWIYCAQHLGPHLTGWCSVPNRDKIALKATERQAAFDECYANGYKIYNGVR